MAIKQSKINKFQTSVYNKDNAKKGKVFNITDSGKNIKNRSSELPKAFKISEGGDMRDNKTDKGYRRINPNEKRR